MPLFRIKSQLVLEEKQNLSQLINDAIKHALTSVWHTDRHRIALHGAFSLPISFINYTVCNIHLVRLLDMLNVNTCRIHVVCTHACLQEIREESY